MPAWVYTFIAVSVTVTWLLANLVAVVHNGHVDTEIHLIMGSVVGATFGLNSLAQRKERNRSDESKQKETNIDARAKQVLDDRNR